MEEINMAKFVHGHRVANRRKFIKGAKLKKKGKHSQSLVSEEIVALAQSKKAKKIGAVNCITVSKKKKLKGYNTDYHGFKKSIKPLLKDHHKKALILGTGGASKAIAYALRSLKIEYDFVSRTADEFQYKYEELDAAIFEEYTIIINTTPVGTHPNVEECPNLDYSLFTKKHIAYDLIYNPEETSFLRKAKAQGAVTKNGYEMLVLQAEKAWKIWNE